MTEEDRSCLSKEQHLVRKSLWAVAVKHVIRSICSKEGGKFVLQQCFSNLGVHENPLRALLRFTWTLWFGWA